MRRFLAVLTALLLAGPAFAGRLGLIRPATTFANDLQGGRALAAFQVLLDRRGVQYDILDQLSVPTSMMEDGNVTFRNGPLTTQHYDAFVEFGFRADHGANAYYAGHTPDSLTLTAVPGGSPRPAYWREGGVPIIFIGNSGNVTGTNWASTAACSTGAGNTPSLFAVTSWLSHAAYIVGGPEVWKSGGGYVPVKRLASVPAGTFTRTVVAYNVVPGTYPDAFANSASQNMVRRDDQAAADSMALWVRYRRKADGTPETTNPRIFAMGHVSSATVIPVEIWDMALAVADSACGHKLIGFAPGYQPQEYAMFLDQVATTGTYTFTPGSIHLGGNMFIPKIDAGNAGTPSADSTDQANIESGLDSLGSLKYYTPAGMKPVPWTAGIAPDSIVFFPWLVTRLKSAMPNLEVTPESWSFVQGSGKRTQPTDGRAYPVGPMAADIFGVLRTRTWFPFNNALPCGSTDTSITCQLIAAQNVLRGYGFKISRSVIAPFFDYVPNNYSGGSRAAIPGPDTLGGALYMAGIDHVIVNPDAVSNALNVSFSVNFAGTVQPTVSDYACFTTHQSKWPVRNTDNSTLSIVSTRGVPDNVVSVNLWSSFYNTGHPQWDEFRYGFIQNIWYSTNIPYYYHNFYSNLSVFIVRIGEAAGTGSGAPATRPWYFPASWVVNGYSAVNRLDNAVVIQPVPVDEL